MQAQCENAARVRYLQTNGVQADLAVVLPTTTVYRRMQIYVSYTAGQRK